MAPTLTDPLDRVERKSVKCELSRTTESFVRAGQLVEAALSKARLTREQAAGVYGVTPSLLARQIAHVDNQHLSFQRLWSMPVAFKRELLLVLADDLGLEVETTVRVRRTV